MSDQMAAAGRLGRRTRDWGLTRAPCAAAAAMQADADSARRGVILRLRVGCSRVVWFQNRLLRQERTALNLNALAPASEAS